MDDGGVGLALQIWPRVSTSTIVRQRSLNCLPTFVYCRIFDLDRRSAVTVDLRCRAPADIAEGASDHPNQRYSAFPSESCSRAVPDVSRKSETLSAAISWRCLCNNFVDTRKREVVLFPAKRRVMRAPIRKLGSSSGVIIPKPILSQIGVEAEDDTIYRWMKTEIVLAPVKRNPRAGWADAAKRLAEAGDDAPVWPEFG